MDRSSFKLVFGEHLMKLRKRSGISLEDYEDKTDKTLQNLFNIEGGGVDVETATLNALAITIGVSISRLVDFDNKIRETIFNTQDIPSDKILKMIRTRMKRIRAEKGLTDEQVSKKFGHDRQWLEKIENGSGEIRLYTLYKIATGLGISLSELLDIHDEYTSKPKTKKRFH